MTDAFDADVLVYAAVPGHPLGARVASLLQALPDRETILPPRVGSMLLIPELLSKPTRDGRSEEVSDLMSLLSRLELFPVDLPTAELAVVLSAAYNLRVPDSVHLATAIRAGADRFLTNNRKDFSTTIGEIRIVYPDQLPEPR